MILLFLLDSADLSGREDLGGGVCFFLLFLVVCFEYLVIFSEGLGCALALPLRFLAPLLSDSRLDGSDSDDRESDESESDELDLLVSDCESKEPDSDTSDDASSSSLSES